MSRITEVFEKLKCKGEKALIAYIMAGDPSLLATKDYFFALVDAGVDIVELGIPFSDPIADGTVIQGASDRALKSGTTPSKVMALVRQIRMENATTPIILMTYYNIFFKYGLERFAREVSGIVDGFIVPDLPVEESAEFLSYCRKYDLDLIFLIAPTTPVDRIKQIIRQSRGFVYLVSRLGVTGARADLAGSAIEVLERVKGCSIPKAIGFGISKPEHVKAIANAGADGIVVGSAFVQIIEQGGDVSERLRKLAMELKVATRKN
ncbi:MAG: tryptophan synthase subunit alpha [Methanocellales archaeon]